MFPPGQWQLLTVKCTKEAKLDSQTTARSILWVSFRNSPTWRFMWRSQPPLRLPLIYTPFHSYPLSILVNSQLIMTLMGKQNKTRNRFDASGPHHSRVQRRYCHSKLSGVHLLFYVRASGSQLEKSSQGIRSTQHHLEPTINSLHLYSP